MHRITFLVAVALATSLVTAGAWATIPDGSGAINACYSKANGALRVVEQASDCRAGETGLIWNQRGRTGDTGPQGPAGPANPTFVSEEEINLSSAQGGTASFIGPTVPAGEYTLQVSIAPFTHFGDTTADVTCAVLPLGQGQGLSDFAHLDRGVGIDGASFAWTQHGSTALSGSLGRVVCRVLSGDDDGFLGFHAVMVATRIG